MNNYRRLGALVEIETGKLDANASSHNGLYPFFTCAVEPLKIDTYIFDCECVLIAGNGDLNVKYYKGKFNAYQRTYIIQSSDSSILHTKYLYYFLLPYVNKLRELSIGGVIKYIKLEHLTDVEIPLPPLDEQHRIARTLDQADRLRHLRRHATQQTESFLQSVFIEMFGDPVTNPKKWKRARLADLGKVQTGNTPPRDEPENYGSYIEWIKTDNIDSDHLQITASTEYLSESGAKQGRILEPLSTLVTCIAGSKNSIGNACLTDRKVAFNQQINAITPFKDVDPFFLFSLMRLVKPVIQQNASNSMKKIITKSKFEELIFFCPPKDMQTEYSVRFRIYSSLLGKHKEAQRQAELLFQSLLHRAFSGQLSEKELVGV